jgi:bacterioferritin (cytochrome b1)
MMTNSLSILERAFRRECRSLTQYLGDSWPWTHRGDREAQELVHSIMADERRWAEQLASIITERGGVPQMGSYPLEFTNSNLHFLALDYMLRRLAEFLEHDVAALRTDLAAAAGDPALQTLLGQMIERKGGQIDALRKLATSLETTNVRSY